MITLSKPFLPEFGTENKFDFYFSLISQDTKQEIPVQEFGYVGHLEPGFYELNLYTHSGAYKEKNIFCYSMGKAHRKTEWQIKEIEKKSCTRVALPTDTAYGYTQLFSKTVKVFERKGNRLENWVAYPDNGFRVVTVGSASGKIEIFDLSIFQQNGKFWLSTGKKYSFHAGRQKEKVYLTDHEIQWGPQWVNLKTLLLSKANGIKLSFHPILKEEIPILKNGDVYVKWFNPTYGKGAAVFMYKGKPLEVSIHYSRMMKPKDAKCPRIPQEKSVYTTNGGVKDPSEKSSFHWELAGMLIPKEH